MKIYDMEDLKKIETHIRGKVRKAVKETLNDEVKLLNKEEQKKVIISEIENNLKIKEDSLSFLEDVFKKNLSLEDLNKLCIKSNLQSTYSFGMFLTGVLLENIQRLYSFSNNLKFNITPTVSINTGLTIKKEDTGEVMGLVDPIYKIYTIYDSFQNNIDILELQLYLLSNGYERSTVLGIEDDILELSKKGLNFYLKSFNDERLVSSRTIAYESYVAETSNSIVALGFQNFNERSYEDKKALTIKTLKEHINYEKDLINDLRKSLKEGRNILDEKNIEMYPDLQTLLEAVI